MTSCRELAFQLADQFRAFGSGMSFKVQLQQPLPVERFHTSCNLCPASHLALSNYHMPLSKHCLGCILHEPWRNPAGGYCCRVGDAATSQGTGSASTCGCSHSRPLEGVHLVPCNLVNLLTFCPCNLVTCDTAAVGAAGCCCQYAVHASAVGRPAKTEHVLECFLHLCLSHVRLIWCALPNCCS